MTLVVRTATVAEIFPLRHAVLRPGRPERDSVYAEDGADSTVHVGGWQGGDLVGCATAFPDPWPGDPPEPRAWRLRGMAVAPDRQGSGIGAVVLAAAVEAARRAGAPLMWANGRTASLDFYRRNGWQVTGEEFIAADTGVGHFRIFQHL